MKPKDNWTISDIWEPDPGMPKQKEKNIDLNQTKKKNQKDSHGIVIDLTNQKKRKKRRKAPKKKLHQQKIYKEHADRLNRHKEKRFSLKRKLSKFTVGEKVTGCALLMLFTLGLLILLECQVVTTLNHDIVTQTAQLETIQASNDSKKGNLVDKQDLSEIEATARAYGMTEPGADQYVYASGMTEEQTQEKTEETAAANSNLQK